jgi:hypothetical protein
MLISQVAVANSQTAGLLMLSGCVVLGALTLLAAGDWRRLLHWLGIEIAVLVLSVPAIAVGFGRGVTHLRAPGFDDGLELAIFLAGGAPAPAVAAVAVALAVFGTLALACLRDSRLVLPLLALVVLPPLLAAIVSHLMRPIWIERVFVTVIPFLCLLLARACFDAKPEAADGTRPASRPGWTARQGAFVVLAVLWGSVAVVGQLTREKGDGYRMAALALQAQARPGDVVLFQAHFTYWCLLWYFAGPHWGDARQAVVVNEAWEGMMRRLPPMATRMLGLGTDHMTREVNGVTAILWDRRQPMPEAARAEGHALFTVRGVSDDAPPDHFPGRRLAAREVFMPVVVERWLPLP